MIDGNDGIELYHYMESICSERVRMTLYEKNIDNWTDHQIHLFKDEQFDPEYLKINPKAQVPTLVHNGHIVRESSNICTYIDDAFPGGNKLKPDSLQQQSDLREWVKHTDETLYPSVSSLSFSMVFRERLNAMGEEAREAHFSKQRDIERTHRQRACVADGNSSPYVLRAVVAWEKMMSGIEARLEIGGPWIMGDQFTLAEISIGPFIMRIQDLQLLPIWMENRPLTKAWWARIQQRPSFAKAEVSVGAEHEKAYKQAGDKYGADIRKLREWYLTDPIGCGRAYDAHRLRQFNVGTTR